MTRCEIKVAWNITYWSKVAARISSYIHVSPFSVYSWHHRSYKLHSPPSSTGSHVVFLHLFLLEAVGVQAGVRASHELMEAWLLNAEGPPGISTVVWMGVLLPPLQCLLFPHMWVRGGRALEVCGRRGTQSALIYFLHLLWFLQRGPEHSLSPSMALGYLEPAVSAQPGLGSVRWVSLAKSIPRFHNHLQL